MSLLCSTNGLFQHTWTMRQGSPFEWVPGAARYRDSTTKRFVKVDVVRAWSEQSITASKDVVTAASEVAVEAPASWYTTMREEIKAEYIRQYLTGIGGRNMMTPADWGRVGGMIADQYRYLANFYQEVQGGLLTQEAIAARSRMYVNSAREAFNASAHISHQVAGYSLKKWVMGQKEHCDNCPVLAGLGWVDIGFRYEVDGQEALPGNGATQCLTNCGCRLEFKK